MTQKQALLAHLKQLRFADPDGGWTYAYHLRGPEFGWQADRRAREMASDDTDLFDTYYKVLETRIHNGKAQYRYKLTKEDRPAPVQPIQETPSPQARLFA